MDEKSRQEVEVVEPNRIAYPEVPAIIIRVRRQCATFGIERHAKALVNGMVD